MQFLALRLPNWAVGAAVVGDEIKHAGKLPIHVCLRAGRFSSFELMRYNASLPTSTTAAPRDKRCMP